MAEGGKVLVAQNRKARHNYLIEDSLEAGLVLTGTEVKSLRRGRASIVEAYADDEGGELYLLNSHIPIYEAAGRFNHEPKRPRKLLVHSRELARLIGLIRREGYTLVPLSLYFNARGIAKVELGLARGKRMVDKRETAKRRDWERQKARLLRERG
ncbi:MAG: SsrA-binding protein SmpB [Kiloniellales bacterium]|nr:SsrA-binding protein SmpB [Kiloniellales bacterium]